MIRNSLLWLLAGAIGTGLLYLFDRHLGAKFTSTASMVILNALMCGVCSLVLASLASGAWRWTAETRNVTKAQAFALAGFAILVINVTSGVVQFDLGLDTETVIATSAVTKASEVFSQKTWCQQPEDKRMRSTADLIKKVAESFQ